MTELFERTLRKGWWNSLWSRLTGKDLRLHSLGESAHLIPGRSEPGIQTVPIPQIRGTEVRDGDFNGEFQPLHRRIRQRWLRVAMAMRSGKPLPAVELIRVGDRYFVRDGHHRISVAKALGQEMIEARVTEWGQDCQVCCT